MSTTIICNKICSYKGCGNTTKTIPPDSDITFFRFPLNAERIFKWKILCGLPNDSKPKYICSKHFDHRKYISCNSRRKTLIQTAVPYSHSDLPNDITNSNEWDEIEASLKENYDDYQEFELVEVDNENEQFGMKNEQYQAIIVDALEADNNDTTNEMQNNKEIPDVIELMPIRVNKVKKKSCTSKASQNCKRNIEVISKKTLNSEESSKKIKMNENDNSNKNIEISIDDKNIPDTDINNILNQDEINTFIFKNEEYIQMPKRMFIEHHNSLVEQIQSKKLLLAQIEYYKNQLVKIKTITDNTELQ